MRLFLLEHLDDGIGHGAHPRGPVQVAVHHQPQVIGAGALRPDADQFRWRAAMCTGNSPIPSPALTASMIIMAEFSSMATRPLPVGSPQKTSDQPGNTDC